MEGQAVGEVIESRDPAFKAGDRAREDRLAALRRGSRKDIAKIDDSVPASYYRNSACQVNGVVRVNEIGAEGGRDVVVSAASAPWARGRSSRSGCRVVGTRRRRSAITSWRKVRRVRRSSVANLRGDLARACPGASTRFRMSAARC
jgi:NADPH-dependent curcumin reductase CurA